MTNTARRSALASLIGTGFLAGSENSFANGIHVGGHGARSSALGGSDVAVTDDSIDAVPEAAVSVPLGETPFTLGVGLLTDAAIQADWTYTDPAGGWRGTASYGRRKHFSEKQSRNWLLQIAS